MDAPLLDIGRSGGYGQIKIIVAQQITAGFVSLTGGEIIFASQLAPPVDLPELPGNG